MGSSTSHSSREHIALLIPPPRRNGTIKIHKAKQTVGLVYLRPMIQRNG